MSFVISCPHPHCLTAGLGCRSAQAARSRAMPPLSGNASRSCKCRRGRRQSALAARGERHQVKARDVAALSETRPRRSRRSTAARAATSASLARSFRLLVLLLTDILASPRSSRSRARSADSVANRLPRKPRRISSSTRRTGRLSSHSSRGRRHPRTALGAPSTCTVRDSRRRWDGRSSRRRASERSHDRSRPVRRVLLEYTRGFPRSRRFATAISGSGAVNGKILVKPRMSVRSSTRKTNMIAPRMLKSPPAAGCRAAPRPARLVVESGGRAP